MSKSRRYIIKLRPQAVKEYKKLQGSDKIKVDDAFKEMEKRAEEVNKRMVKKSYSDLTHTRESKFSNGIRIIYYVSNRTVNISEKIVEVLLIGFKKNNTAIYKEAEYRLKEVLLISGDDDNDSELYFRTYYGEELEETEQIDISQESMLDEIFGNFDNLNTSLQNEIMDLYIEGKIKESYEVFRKGTTGN